MTEFIRTAADAIGDLDPSSKVSQGGTLRGLRSRGSPPTAQEAIMLCTLM
jgi:hypothetical protein